MECEICGLEGQVGEAVSRCADCGEWICDLHTKSRTDGAALCPSCFEAQEDTGANPIREDVEEPEGLV